MNRSTPERNLWKRFPGQEATYKRLSAHFRKTFRLRGIPKSPELTLRLRDMLMAYLLMQHLERIMLDVAKTDQNEDTKARAEISLIEAHGKASERWRKTMKELNNYCVTTGRPLNMGLADFMKPIILKVNKALQMEKAPTAEIGGALSVGCSRFSVSCDEEKAGIRDPFPKRSTNASMSQRPEEHEIRQNPGEPNTISGFSHEKWV